MRVLLSLVMAIFLTACGTMEQSLKLEEQYVPHENTRVAIGNVSDERLEPLCGDVENMLRDALAEKLKSHKIYCEKAQGHDLVLNARVKMSMGNLWDVIYMIGSSHGGGNPSLAVEYELLDHAGKVIGAARASRGVVSSCPPDEYQKTILSNLANEVVNDLASQVRW